MKFLQKMEKIHNHHCSSIFMIRALYTHGEGEGERQMEIKLIVRKCVKSLEVFQVNNMKKCAGNLTI